VERADILAATERGVRGVGSIQGVIRTRNHGVDPRVDLGDPAEARLDDLAGRDVAAPDERGQPPGRLRPELVRGYPLASMARTLSRRR
jgi:hypothetical protein